MSRASLVDRAVTAFLALDAFGKALTARQVRIPPADFDNPDNLRFAFERYENAGMALDLLVDDIEDEASNLARNEVKP